MEEMMGLELSSALVNRHDHVFSSAMQPMHPTAVQPARHGPLTGHIVSSLARVHPQELPPASPPWCLEQVLRLCWKHALLPEPAQSLMVMEV